MPRVDSVSELWPMGRRHGQDQQMTHYHQHQSERYQQMQRKSLDKSSMMVSQLRKYQCPKCDKSFSQSYSMYRHYRYECDSLPRYQYFRPIVLEKLQPTVLRHRHSRQLVRLQNVLNRRGFPCPKCSRIFHTSGGMNRHYRLECVDLPRFKCPHCDMKSKYTQAIYRHIRAKHRNMELRFVKLY
ncbi:zinc finger protein 551-like [Vespula squamosa]|uniref:Zinc finger protein 551-like n=1 Tax=Vespula squamosa TaxID=30214 RepID=A0ABD2A260_VESSQ